MKLTSSIFNIGVEVDNQFRYIAIEIRFFALFKSGIVRVVVYGKRPRRAEGGFRDGSMNTNVVVFFL